MNFDVPATDSALYDLLQSRFGIGDWHEGSETPWFKARGTEISRMKATMRKRRLTREDMALAVWHADANNIPIRAVWQLCELVAEARKAKRTEARAKTSDVREQLTVAAAAAYEAGEDGWADRLYAADLSSGPTVLRLWAEHQERTR